MYKIAVNLLSGILVILFLTFLKLIGKRKASNICSYFFTKLGPHTRFNQRAIKNISFIWPKKKQEEINKITKKMWNNLGRNFGEFVHLYKFNPELCQDTNINGLRKVKALFQKNKKMKKGIIFFSAHYGNWEMGAPILKKLGLKPLCLYRKSNNKIIENIIQKIRNSNGEYAPKGDIGAKRSFLWLRKGKSLALLMDQKLNEGPAIEFLGKKANTASFIADIALKMDLDIIPIKIKRESNLKNSITFLNKIEMPNNKLNKNEKVNFILKKINTIISSWILEDPSQWLWIHRRWTKDIYKT